MELILIRHAEPDLTGDDLTDPPLTERGHRQAAATAAFLSHTHLHAIYVSPQTRAQQTLVPLLGERRLVPVTDERIAEFDYNKGGYFSPARFQGVSREQALAELEEAQGDDFHDRVSEALATMIDANPGRTVAAVCHGGVINSIVREVLEARQPIAPMHASVTRVVASRSGVRSLLSFNEHHWLNDL